MDLILFPLFEGAANWALFDALATGVSVPASNRCFVPEVISDGRDGLLFDADDAQGLARATLELLGQPETRALMGRRGRAKITRRFSLDQAVEGHQAIIMEAVAPAERPAATPAPAYAAVSASRVD